MLCRPSILALFGTCAVTLLGCSGGGPTAGKLVQPGCTSGDGSDGSTGADDEPVGLCVVSCNLGCSQLGCTVSDIAQNQPIVLAFNQEVDPSSVSTASFSLRTPTGQEPVGTYLVSGTTVTFVPEIQVVGGASFFGFEANATYTLTLPGGDGEFNALRSTGGDRLSNTVICNLNVTRGVLDLDGEAPIATLESPSVTTAVPRATSIVLEFSEIIDVTPFLQATALNPPVKVLATKTRPAAGGGIECDPGFAPLAVGGNWTVVNDVVRQVSTATFTSNQEIPFGACVIISVTTAVRDLSGKPSQGQTFSYFVESGPGGDDSIVETFEKALQFDSNSSSGTWVGGAKPGILGWDGLHGDFVANDGISIGPGVFLWSTDDQDIPASRTRTGVTETVTDGVFRFSRFLLPSGITVRFVGRNPARIYVRGGMSIEGTLDFSGESTLEHDGSELLGQLGGVAGAGGGNGGKGGDSGDGDTNVPRFNGQPGEDVRPLGASAYQGTSRPLATAGPPVKPESIHTKPGFTLAGQPLIPRTSNTRGNGSHQFPVSGSNGDVQGALFSDQVAAGGGGGGYLIPGQPGVALVTTSKKSEHLGPPAVGGVPFPRMSAPPPGESVHDYYLIGGAGGGGAGTHLYGSGVFTPEWNSGSGGGGGGGACGIRVGSSLTMAVTGSILAVGGSPSDSSKSNRYSAAGGGGAGGSIVIQSAQIPLLTGLLDVRGGIGGLLSFDGTNAQMRSKAGDGSHGYVRVEAPGTLPSDPVLWTGPVAPATGASEIAVLEEEDLISGVQSLWYRTGSLFPPRFLRYELEATIDNTFHTFSDDDTFGQLADGAVTLWIQGAEEDVFGLIDPSKITPWRRYVGPFAPVGQGSLSDDGGSAFRLLILFDRAQGSDIIVHKVSVFFTTG